MKRKRQIICFSMLVLVSLALWAPDVETFQSFNDSPDCSSCHYPHPPYNCATCHTIFSAGPSSNGHEAHLNIGLPQFCNTCHIDIGDDPLTSTCTSCHLKMGLVNHHNYAPVSPPFYQTENGRCWMCHEGTPDTEDTIPPGYEGTCLDPCDGSEELFSTGSFTSSLDNDGDLLVDNTDPDCFVCSVNKTKVMESSIEYSSIQEACENASDNNTIQINKTTFVEDMYIASNNTVILESGYDCDINSISGKSTLEGKVTIGSGALILKSGTLQIQTPIEDCDDGLDNDSDTFFDCDDPDCYNSPLCLPLTEDVCNDCVDNDNDGQRDCSDTDCESDPVCESSPPDDHTNSVSGYMHKPGREDPYGNDCADCHGSDLNGSSFARSCNDCHLLNHTEEVSSYMHKPGKYDPVGNGCIDCHGSDLSGSANGRSCNACHDISHNEDVGGFLHKPGKEDPVSNGCIACHGSDLNGTAIAPSCNSCHGLNHTEDVGGFLHKPGKEDPVANYCGSCHGADLSGSAIAPSCNACHGLNHTEDVGGFLHKPGKEDPVANFCGSCHGADLNGSAIAPSCNACHGLNHTEDVGGFLHKPGKEDPVANYCGSCHGADLSGSAIAPSCNACHALNHTDNVGGYMHKPGREYPVANYCGSCHGADLNGSAIAPSCNACHGLNHTEDVAGFMHMPGKEDPANNGCTACHGSDLNGSAIAPSCNACHGTQGAHATHLGGTLGAIGCSQCHDTDDYPFFKSGTDGSGDGKYNLAETDVCDECHSADGVASAKAYYMNDAGTWVAAEGEDGYCGSCHDVTPGYNGGSEAFDVMGDSVTYGYFVTGHGKAADNFASLSWQDTAAAGNPAANRSCANCHDLASLHFGSATNRLKAGFENNQTNDNCNNCHSPAGSATADPQWYTDSVDYEASAHSDTLCTDCHDVHGMAGTHPAMTVANQESLCYQCHKDGMVQNNAISGAALSDNIEQAFGLSEVHDLETDYSIGSNNYKLECVTCHNVHIISGKYWDADQNKSPISPIIANTTVWGDDSGEKMDDYAGDGTYRTPNSDTFSGAELPDYVTFCLECHGTPGPAPFGISWGNDEPHGQNSANQPNGYGTCPNWYGCGKAAGWDNDDCIGDQSECWPVITRGKGDQIMSRKPYNHEERIAGANFTLSCTDCHEAHGSNVSSMIRSNPNNGTGTQIWNTMCNNCHYYYSDWHAGMSCGTASCHAANSIHRMGSKTGSGGTRSFDPDLVMHYAFNNNLKDSGDWQMDGKWMDNIAGSFTSGVSGQAIVLDGGKNVQVGTENDYWSTDAGKHGTWVYTNMKYNTTLESWVYPTDDSVSEHKIFTKHTGYNQGDYELSLQKIGGSWRVAFLVQIDNNAGDQGGQSGVRGAYSSVNVPLNGWTHVAATFDTAGADRDENDPTIGRIRIYVNGEDVTTSDSSGSYIQPGTDETSIFAYAENSPWNEGICGGGHWCAGEFSVGGFYGWQNAFIGRIDEAKVWNVTKDGTYFQSVDEASPPRISIVEGMIGSTELTVTFSEGVYAYAGGTGNLQASDFVLTDTNADNPRTITGVTHSAGDSTAMLTMDAPLTASDVDADIIAAFDASSIFDEYDNSAGTDAVTIGLASICPTSPVSIQLNEASASTYIMDSQGVLYGVVNDPVDTLLGDGYFTGDGTDNYINFAYNSTCMQVDRKMTLEARVKPTEIGSDDQYIKRVFARDGGGNYQMSVWRNNTWVDYNSPDDTASIALWVNVVDNHGGNNWKVVLTDYDACPIVSDHWYQAKVVWDSDKGGTPDEFFVPADIYVDDQGSNGDNADEAWSGMANCTNSAQSYNDGDAKKLYTGDEIIKGDGTFAIGANRGNLTNGTHNFNGKIDWITWNPSVD